MRLANASTEFKADRGWVHDIRAVLNQVALGGPDVLSRVVDETNSRFRSHLTSAFRPGPHASGWDLEFCHIVTPFRPDALDVFSSYMASAPPDFTSFNALRPQANDRNRVLLDAELPSWETVSQTDIGSRLFPRLGLSGTSRMRVLVCDRGMLLSWFGSYRQEPFTARERRMWQGILPALTKRIRLERKLSANGAALSLSAALDALAAPAFILNREGGLEFGNSVGYALFAAGRTDLLMELRASLKNPLGGAARFSISPIRSAGLPELFLALGNVRPAPDFEARLAAARARWKLTRRQVEVLSLVARGEQNKDIAVRLDCALGTVEIHVSALLAKARAESRSQLVSRFYTEA